MPVYDRDMTLEKMQELVDAGAKCGDDGGALVIAWGGAIGYDGYILRCGNDINHSTIMRIGRKTKAEVEGQKVFRGYTMKALQEYTAPEMVERANSAGLFPQGMNSAQRTAIATICVEYGLDPLMNELMLYQGRPFVTMAARLRKAQEAGDFAGISTRAATDEEKKSRGYDVEDYVMLAEARKVIGGVVAGPFQGWGVVKKATADRADPHLPISDNPAQHAEKRAISRALRMAWHIPLPSYEDIGEEINGGVRVIDITPEAPDDESATKAAGNGKDTPAATKEAVNTDTPVADAVDVEKKKAATKATAKKKAANDKADMTFQELLDKVKAKGAGYTESWLFRNLGMSVDEAKADPKRAWQEICSVAGW